MPQSHKTRVIRRAFFCAAHSLYRENLTFEENQSMYGAAANPHGLGHNYVLEVHVEGPVDNHSGMIMPIHELDAIIQEVTTTLDHKFLNYDLPYFQKIFPTTENVAKYCFDFLSSVISRDGRALVQVRLFETDDVWVDVLLSP